MKVSELEGANLDHWVALAQGWKMEHGYLVSEFDASDRRVFISPYNWTPSTHWSQGGPIIEREHLECSYHQDSGTGEFYWQVTPEGATNPEWWGEHPSLLTAAMRCFVASRFGDTVGD